MKKRKQKKLLFFTVLLMMIGFATVTTTLVMNGTLNLLGDTEAFAGDVIFTKAKTETGGLASIIKEGKEITFTSKELSKVNESTTLNFDITNKNRQYDAIASINCNTSVSDYADYITIAPNKTEYEISAGGTVSGHLTATLIKSYDKEEATEVTFTCTLNVEARERDTMGDEYVPVEPFSQAGTLMKTEINDMNGQSLTGKIWNYRGSITKVVFEDTMSPHETTEDLIFDLSDKQDESVMGYMIPNEDDNNLYTVYIQSETGVKANQDSSNLFLLFEKLEIIEGLEYFDTSEVTNMNAMFSNCQSLKSLDLSNFNTSKVTNMSDMFLNMETIEELDLSSFNTSQVTDMNYMFFCLQHSNLKKLNINNFDTSQVTNMYFMFSGCNKLTTTITIRGTACTLYYSMFSNATTEEGAQITVNYTEDASELVDDMIATKSENSNVIKGNIVTI